MTSRVASRYSKSLLELAVERKCDEQVYQEMAEISSLNQTSADFAALLKNPIVDSGRKKQVVNKLFLSYSPTSRAFLELVIGRKREADLPDMAVSYMERYNKLKGVAKATVRSAIPLSSEAMSKVQKYLQGAVQKDSIELENIIDKSVIGGMVIHFEDRLLDLSVARELKEIRKHLIYN